MFRHYGKTRTLSHNLKIASLLSFVAGIVNVAGFLAIKKLTTNVTGHFTYFMDEVYNRNYTQALIYFLYIFFFLLGSFVSNTAIEVISRKSEQYIYAIPASAECLILFTIGFFSRYLIAETPDVIAFSLLFAMGLQNSLVTTISKARVRTTHLTGLFTDLGIELSQLIFYKTPDQRKKLYSSIRLRLTIIGFFFIGGIVACIAYYKIELYVLIFAALALVSGLIYDTVKFRVILLRRRFKSS